MNREDVIREIQERYRRLGRKLNEFERRHWAAVEATKLGRGGITIVSNALRISPNTIKRGIQEIATGQADSYSPASSRIRKPGGGRKSKEAAVGAFSRTRSQKNSTVTEAEYPTSGMSGLEGDGHAQPASIELSSTMIDHTALKQPDQPEIP